MVTRKKSILFFVACLIVSLIFSAFAIIAEPAKADDESTTTPITFETYAKTTVGGSIRKTEGSTGLRFRWEMTETQYNAFLSSEDTVTYGMIIAPLSYNTANKINAENVFGENAVYTDKANEEGKTRIINLCGTELTSATVETSTVYYFNGAITNIAEENYTTKFIGVGYIGIQKQGEETTTYYFADNETCVKNARTVVYVAESYKTDTGDTVLNGFITKGYENLDLSLTGELNSNDDFDALVEKGNDGIIYGSGTYTITQNVDESKFVYAGEKLPGATFTYPHYDNVIEDFNSASSIVAAYSLNKNAVPEKNTQNETAEWLATFANKYGVLKLNATRKVTINKVDIQEYHIKSSFRDSSFYVDKEWDYLSVILYVAGEEGETVEIGYSQGMGNYNTFGNMVVNCNEWVELKVAKKTALSMISKDSDGNQTMETFAKKMSVDDRTESWRHSLIGIKTEKDMTVYIDKVTYESETNITCTEQDGTVTLSAAYGEITDGFAYSVKKPNGNTENITGNTYTLTDGGVYTFTASATIYGVVHTAQKQVVFHAANEIDGFHTSDSVVAAFGKNKNTQLESAEWLESFEGRNGVIKLGRYEYFEGSIKNEKYEYTPKNLYNIKSSFRDNTFYNNDEEWDYISIWIYVVGESNQTVNVCLTKYGNCSTVVNCNTWTEVKFEKANTLFLSEGKDSSGNYLRNQTSLSDWLASTGPTKVDGQYISSYNSFLGIELEDYKNEDVTIYLDSITYEKNVESNG